MPRKPRKLPDYFTMEEAANGLVQATESSDTRLAMRLMLRCGPSCLRGPAGAAVSAPL